MACCCGDGTPARCRRCSCGWPLLAALALARLRSPSVARAPRPGTSLAVRECPLFHACAIQACRTRPHHADGSLDAFGGRSGESPCTSLGRPTRSTVRGARARLQPRRRGLGSPMGRRHTAAAQAPLRCRCRDGPSRNGRGRFGVRHGPASASSRALTCATTRAMTRAQASADPPCTTKRHRRRQRTAAVARGHAASCTYWPHSSLPLVASMSSAAARPRTRADPRRHSDAVIARERVRLQTPHGGPRAWLLLARCDNGQVGLRPGRTSGSARPRRGRRAQTAPALFDNRYSAAVPIPPRVHRIPCPSRSSAPTSPTSSP